MVWVSPTLRLPRFSARGCCTVPCARSRSWGTSARRSLTSRGARGVSRRTFYDLFASREECIAALVESVVRDLREEIDSAGIPGLPWRERVRGGLERILCFLDREPALARVCVVQALQGGPALLALRDRILGELAAVVDQGRTVGVRGAGCAPLTAEGLVGAAFTIIQARLRSEQRAPRSAQPAALSELAGELMGMIVLPYLGPAAARREQARPTPLAVSQTGPTDSGQTDPLASLNMRLTYRTARVLEAIAEHPAASNRAAGEHAGIVDQGQISKLLARLERLGLIENSSDGHAKGEPNAWALTRRGDDVARSISNHTRHETNRQVA